MKRSLWIVILVLVLGGYAGFQQYSSWSLSKPQDKTATQSVESGGRGTAGGGQGRGGAEGRGGGRSRDAVPVLVATAAQKSVPAQIRAVGNAEPFATVSIKSQVTGVPSWWKNSTYRASSMIRFGPMPTPRNPFWMRIKRRWTMPRFS